MGEGNAIYVFHADHGHSLIGNEIKSANNIRMNERETPAGFTFQVFAGGGTETRRLRHEFERHQSLELVLEREPDHTHFALAEDFLEGETLEELSAGD
jgi:hypothetical protein